jgi:hypothetical protein
MNNRDVQRGVVLEVPYKEKDEAKALGAMWDPEMRKWFVPRGADPEPFEKWIPDGKSSEAH